MRKSETHTPLSENMSENMTEKGMPSASLSARDEARMNGLEVTTNKLSRDVGVLQEKMTHLATREDIAELRAETHASIAEVKSEIAEVKVEVAQVKAENRESVAELKVMIEQTNTRIAQMETRILRLLFGLSGAVVLTLISALMGII